MSHVDPDHEAQDSASSQHGNGASTTALATIENQLHALPAAGWSYGPPQRPEILSAKPNPLDLMHAMRRRWPLAVGVGSAVGLLALVLVWFLIPVRYEAFALLKVAEQPGGILDRSIGGREAFDIFKRTQAAVITSGPVIRATLREPSIAGMSAVREHAHDAESWLSNLIAVDYPNDAEVMRVAVKTENKAESVKLVDTVVQSYLSEVVHRQREKQFAHEDELRKKYNSIMQDFKRQSEALFALEQSQQVETTDAAQVKRQIAEDALLEALVRRRKLQTDIHDAETEMVILQAKKSEPDANKIPEVVVEMELQRDPVVVNLNRAKSDYQSYLARLMAVTINHAESKQIAQVNQMITHIDQQIEEHKADARPRVMELLAAQDQMDSWRGTKATTMTSLQEKRGHLEEQLKEAEAAIVEKSKVFDDIHAYSTDVTAKREELLALKQLMTQLKSKIDLTEVERLAQERIQLIDSAQLASPRGDAVRKYVSVAFAGVFGFALVVVGIAFFEFQSRKLNGTEQVNDGLGIKVIGELPSVRGRKWRRLKHGKGPAVLKALMAERIDGTRTALIHSTAKNPPRVVMVTSADPHEGKTTTSSQLAASLARAGRRTLLVDADIRNPGVHRVFDMPLEPGLSELLRGEADRDAVVHPTRTANLWLLPAGRCDLRAVQSLSTSYLGTSIAALCAQFDFVIIDSGPVLKVADSLLVGQHVDTAILSVLKDSSKMPHVYEACERLRSVGIAVMGAVINGVNDDAAQHGVELLMSEQTA